MADQDKKEVAPAAATEHEQQPSNSNSVLEDREGGADAVLEAKIERVYRKLDYRIIPAFWTLYFLCSAIRSNVGLSLTMNRESGNSLGQRLNLTGKEISTGLALFYVCYVVFDAPANLIMTRVSPNAWMARIVICVGIIGVCHLALDDAWNFYLLRLLFGIVIAGMWPGMAYFLSLFYPPSRTGKRIGHYFTAAQVSAAVAGLVSAGFQKMDTLGGLTGYQWMFLIYGLVTICLGVVLLWWLPDRPKPPGHVVEPPKGYHKYLPRDRPALEGEDAVIHYDDLTRVYHAPRWGLRDLGRVLLDWRLWPLTIMYFGVVGVGIGVQSFGTLIINAAVPGLSSIKLSLLFAPIWICDLLAILLVTPLSDRFHRVRYLFFIFPAMLQMVGLLVVVYASAPWARYSGLLLVGFGLGPTVPNCMAWTTEIFQPRHGDIGVAAATALVSGLGNLGSVTTTYALYTGWSSDAQPGPKQYRKSTLVMVGILAISVVSALGMAAAVRFIDGRKPTGETQGIIVEDGAARREREQRGFDGMWRFGKAKKPAASS